MAKKALLMILDGWGMGNHGKGDVIFNTPTPYMDYLAQNYPMSQLQASGENVGLPDGQMGNSEVGHLNIGAGRIVYQDLVKINRACADGSIFEESRNSFCLRICQAERQERAFDGIDLYRRCALLVGSSVHVVRHFQDLRHRTYLRALFHGRPRHRPEKAVRVSLNSCRLNAKRRVASSLPSSAVSTPWTATSVGSV